MIKEFLTIITCIAAAGSLVSCGSTDSSSEATVTATETVSTRKVEIPSAAQKAIENMKEKASENAGKLKTSGGGFIDPGKEAKAVLRECINTMFTSTVEDTLKYFYPEPIYSAVINGDARNNFKSQGVPGNEVTDLRLDSSTRLAPDTGYALAEMYFNKNAESNGVTGYSAKVINGFCVSFTADLVINGQKDTDSEEMILVELENDGWKVIPMSTDDLMKAVKE